MSQKSSLVQITRSVSRSLTADTARTAWSGELIFFVCSTAKNRRLVLPLIGDDQA
jgi:hypothetical protein